MAASKRAGVTPSGRQQFWLDHHEAQVKSGQSAKVYAAAHGLSVFGLYGARKRLRAQGHLEPASRRRTPPAPAVSFARVAVAASPSDPRFRLDLPGGLVLSWSGADIPQSVIDLLDRQSGRR